MLIQIGLFWYKVTEMYRCRHTTPTKEIYNLYKPHEETQNPYKSGVSQEMHSDSHIAYTAPS